MAFLVGTVVYRLVSKLLDKILCMLMPLKSLNSYDGLLAMDNERNNANVMACFRLEHASFEKMRVWMRNVHMETIPFGKCKLTTYFGRYFWEKMSDKDFDAMFEKEIFTNVKGVHTKQQLEAFICK